MSLLGIERMVERVQLCMGAQGPEQQQQITKVMNNLPHILIPFCCINLLFQKQKSSTEQATEGGEKPHRPKVEPYRRMLPGLKLDKDGAAHVSEEEEEEEKPSLPTPRKRLMNFKIPLINRGGQRRDQSLSSVVARRRLFSEGEWWQLVLYQVSYRTKVLLFVFTHTHTHRRNS